jgi:enoyl-CoA hydratase/carnithine racemase
LDKVSESIAQTFVDRTGKSMDEIKAMMEAETWMSAADCVKNGFATQIAEEPDEQSGEAMALARTFKSLKFHKHLPKQLQNDEAAEEQMCACDCSNCVAGDCANCTNQDCTDMNCVDCPMQKAAEEAGMDDSNLSQYEARIRLLSLESK